MLSDWVRCGGPGPPGVRTGEESDPTGRVRTLGVRGGKEVPISGLRIRQLTLEGVSWGRDVLKGDSRGRREDVPDPGEEQGLGRKVEADGTRITRDGPLGTRGVYHWDVTSRVGSESV